VNDWIATKDRFPEPFTDVEIRLESDPNHDPGYIIWSPDLGLWCGYQRNYLPREVSHWRPLTHLEGENDNLHCQASHRFSA
jgi:hypothetical protein